MATFVPNGRRGARRTGVHGSSRRLPRTVKVRHIRDLPALKFPIHTYGGIGTGSFHKPRLASRVSSSSCFSCSSDEYRQNHQVRPAFTISLLTGCHRAITCRHLCGRTCRGQWLRLSHPSVQLALGQAALPAGRSRANEAGPSSYYCGQTDSERERHHSNRLILLSTELFPTVFPPSEPPGQ